jgi:TPR repeat protein
VLIKYYSNTDKEKSSELFELLTHEKSNSGKLGFCYANGFGMEKDLTKAYEYYVEEYTANPTSESNNKALINCYKFGIGVAQDSEKAAFLKDNL